jgi:hypothetical protein
MFYLDGRHCSCVERNVKLKIFIYTCRDYVAACLLTEKGFADCVCFRHQLPGVKDPTDWGPSGNRDWLFLTVWTQYNSPLPLLFLMTDTHPVSETLCAYLRERRAWYSYHENHVRISADILGMILIGFPPPRIQIRIIILRRSFLFSNRRHACEVIYFVSKIFLMAHRCQIFSYTITSWLESQ